MAITWVKEDGTGLENSNTYGLPADVIAYAANRGISLVESTLDYDIQMTMDYLESLNMQGSQLDPGVQALHFPAYPIFINGVLVTDAIPKNLINAFFELVVMFNAGQDITKPQGRKIKSASAAVLSVTYADDAKEDTTYPRLDMFLKPLLFNNNSFHTTAVRTYG